MPEKLPPQNVYYYTLEEHTKSEKYTKVLQLWIGWLNKKKEESQSLQLQLLVIGKPLKMYILETLILLLDSTLLIHQDT
jgi:hypothetical protein